MIYNLSILFCIHLFLIYYSYVFLICIQKRLIIYLLIYLVAFLRRNSTINSDFFEYSDTPEGASDDVTLLKKEIKILKWNLNISETSLKVG